MPLSIVVVKLLFILTLLISVSQTLSDQQYGEEEGTATEEVEVGDKGEIISAEGPAETASSFAPLGKPDEFMTSTTGVKLAVRRWLPQEEIRSVVVVLHGGAGWHSGYMGILGESLKTKGIAVIAYDQVGSGFSEGMKGGLRCYFDTMDTVINDASLMIQMARTQYPGKKVFALGESFGCTVLLHQILTQQKVAALNEKEGGGGADDADAVVLADGYILAGPVVKVLPEMLPPTFVIMIVNFLAQFVPMLPMPGTDFFSTFDLAFGDPRWAQAGRADPFVQEAAVTPPRLGMASSVLSTMMNNYNSLQDVNVPFQIFMGENEHRVDVDAVQKLPRVAKSKDKGIEIVPGGYHQLFQDMPNVTASVCDGIARWILERTTTT